MRKGDGYPEACNVTLIYLQSTHSGPKRFSVDELFGEVSKRHLELDNFWNCAGGIYLKMIGRRPEKEKLYI